MLSWTGQTDLWQQLISDSDATNLTMGKTLIREGQRKLQAILGIYFTEETRTFLTVTDTISGTSNKAYPLPENFKALSDLYVTVGTTQYPATLIQDEELWRQMSSTTTQSTSNFLQFCFIRWDRVELYPIPSSANTATIIYQTQAKDLQADNYTTGTITTLMNYADTDATKVVTGASSVWTSAMVGRYFRIDVDGEWYRIASRSSDTSITLAQFYRGVAISAGTSAYTIGQMPPTPADTHELPVYYACWKYYLFRKDITMAREFEKMWKEGVKEAEVAWANRSSSQIIRGYPYAKRRLPVNPNMWPQDMS